MLFPWSVLTTLVLIFLVVDLRVFNRIPRVISGREAFNVCLVWLGVSLLFNIFVWYWMGSEPALAFFTGYLLEKLLSLDNMFVFAVIFSFFEVSSRHQHRILFWGILGAIAFRLFLIFIGVKLIETFEWVLYIFGALLMYSSYKIYYTRAHPTASAIETNYFIHWARTHLPLQENYKGRRFLLHINGKWLITPAFLVLLIIEASDIVFAIDSISAIFAITLDPFIIFSSNIFAVFGLRSLYFLLALIIPRFYYLQYALSIILAFVGFKLLFANHFKIPVGFSLSAIVCILLGAILLSLWKHKHGKNSH